MSKTASPLINVTVFARDNDKPGNRDIVAFFNQYLQPLVQAGLRFKFTVADKIEKELISRGIDKLPAIEVKTTKGVKNFVTPMEIKNALLKYIDVKVEMPRRAGRPEDDLQDYYSREMNMEKYEADLEDGDETQKKDIMSRVQAEMERRQTETDKRPAKPRARATRPPNVRPGKSCDETTRSRAQTPQERVREAGGDPANRDDTLILSMMETSDD